MGDILFLAHRVPYPPDRGDKIRGYHVLRHLARSHRVHLVAFADDPRDMHHDEALNALTDTHLVSWRAKPKWRAAVEALATRSAVSIAAFESERIHTAVADVLARQRIDAAYVFSSQMAQYVPAGLRTVMDFVDVDAAKFAAYAEDANPASAWLMRREARLLLAHDRAVAQRAAASLFVSTAEAALFRRETGAERVEVLENGIDTVFFDPAAVFDPVKQAAPLLVFTGQMDYRPNIDAVTWFAGDVLPLVRTWHPEAQFAIVGRGPTAAVRGLDRTPGVLVTGEVADIRGWLAAAAVVVAPLKLARGIQNKVLEAMAMARPVVASPAAAEGIDHAGTLRVADDAAAMAAAVTALVDDQHRATSLGIAGRAQVVARYGWDARLAPLDALVAGAPAPAMAVA